MKINPFFLFVLLFLFNSCKTNLTPTAQDEEAILQMMTMDMTSAWEKNDKSWIAANYLEDADIGFPSGPIFSGKENLPVSGSSVPGGRKFKAEIQSLRFISPDVAIVNNHAHFTGGKNDKGEALPDSRDAGTFVLKKLDGKWKIAALRVLPMRSDLEKDRLEISKALETFAVSWKNDNAAQGAYLFTEDAINYRPDAEPDRGRAAIFKMSEGWLNNNTIKELKFTTLDLDIIGDHAYEMGTFIQEVIPRPNGKSRQQQGRYMATWILDPDGQWRIKTFLFNNAPASGSK